MRVAICGAHAGGLQALRAVSNFGCEITAVATLLGEKSLGSGMEQFARSLGAPVLSSAEVKSVSFAERLRSSNTDLLIAVQLPHVVCPEALEAPHIGCFNLHPSLLPRYAGLHPASWAIYRGEREHGVTLHWMTSTVDAGPIVSQRVVAVSQTDTPPILLRNCLRAGISLISELLAFASTAGHIPRQSQDLSGREYFGREIPGDGHINWNRPARDIVNLTRAFDYRPFSCPWGYLTTAALGPRTTILKTEDTGVSSNAAPGTVIRGLDEGIRIAASDHWVLITEHLEIEG